MPTTSNFGWNTPADTDLVKDGAAAIRTLGNNIDASLVDLKGGTTGQVLAKASNADLDYTWSNVDPLTILDAKGDLITATAADTPARLAVGTDGQYLQADSSTSTGLKWGSISAGGLTTITSGSLSGSSVTLNSIPSTYKNLQLVIRDFLPSTDGNELLGRLNGTTSGDYYRYDGSGANNISNNDTEFYFSATSDNAVSDGLVIVDFPDYANTSTWKMSYSRSFAANNTTASNLNFRTTWGVLKTTAAISSITMFVLSGTMSGTYVLYGEN